MLSRHAGQTTSRMRPSCLRAVTPSSRPISSTILPSLSRITVVPVKCIFRPVAGGREPSLSPRTRQLIDDMRAEWAELDRRIAAFDNEFAARARTDADARRLATIPGIGVLNATALVAAIGKGQTFARGRDLVAWLGLVPRQITTGGKPRLVGITKRGEQA